MSIFCAGGGMNNDANMGHSDRMAVRERRQDREKVKIVEHGIRVQEDYGYVRAAKYLYQSGVSWPVIQRVLHYPHRRRHVKIAEINRFLH